MLPYARSLIFRHNRCHAMGKSSSYIPTSKVIRSCSYSKISLKSLMLFNLAFLMKCKYCKLCIAKCCSFFCLFTECTSTLKAQDTNDRITEVLQFTSERMARVSGEQVFAIQVRYIQVMFLKSRSCVK